MPRVQRQKPKCKFNEGNYRRRGLPFLDEDFKGQCAYSMAHRIFHGEHEIDHHNPTLGGKRRNAYTNLMPALRHCNGKKSDHWPNARQLRAGMRFLDPTKEDDYGVHIFEDSDTHELKGVTNAGKWQIEMCDLNAPFLVTARKERADLALLLANRQWRAKPGKWDKMPEMLRAMEDLHSKLAFKIPPIAPPPP